jgi:flagellar basal-body rod modification protein FlgD
MFADGLKNHHSEPKFSALLQFCKWLTIAGNFQTFLTLLTTQLKNQDPTSPLDTDQFTQQLVEFAQVEQQLKSNTQLATLVSRSRPPKRPRR